MIYLEYAATNPFTKYPCSKYGQFLNPNANYAYKEKKLLDDCANTVKAAIGAKGGKVVFGGTASQLVENLMTQVEDAYKKYFCICSAYEHDSSYRFKFKVVEDIVQLENILIDYDGEEWKPLVLWQGCNNVTGQIMPIEKIGKLCKKYDAFFLCDATALVGHAPIPENIDEWCSAFWYSGHKLGTELGIGTMWLSKEFNDWLGDFKLHGTPNVAGALCIADATEMTVRNQKENFGYWVDLYYILKRYLEENGIEYQVVCGDCAWGEWTPAIHAIRLNGINADALQQYLASKQIYVGLGASACAESHDYRVLNAFGLSDEEASEVIRVSFNDSNGADDVFNLVKGIKEFKERFIR